MREVWPWGFESPLFVSVPTDAFQLGKARPGEGNRPWSGGPGTAALATGLVETAWILRELRQRCPAAFAFVDWDEFTAAGVGLFLWEAFVTGTAKAATHTDHALIAARTFRDALAAPAAANAVTAEGPISLLGTAMMWSGWTTDLDALHTPCLAIKASPPHVASHDLHAASPPEVSSLRISPVGSLRDRADWPRNTTNSPTLGLHRVGLFAVCGRTGSWRLAEAGNRLRGGCA